MEAKHWVSNTSAYLILANVINNFTQAYRSRIGCKVTPPPNVSGCDLQAECHLRWDVHAEQAN